jgi:hypothetical protein
VRRERRSEQECGPPTGSFLQAGKMEEMFGGGTREQFEQMMRDLGGKPPSSSSGGRPPPEEFRDLDDPESQNKT